MSTNKSGADLEDVLGGFGDFLNSLSTKKGNEKKEEKKSGKKDEVENEAFTPEHLKEFRVYFSVGDNPILKKLVGGLMLEFFVKDLTDEELERFLYSSDRDLQVSAAAEILERPVTSTETLKKILSLDEPNLIIGIRRLLHLARKAAERK